ncbi:hypothetical protein [Methylobacterium sp. CM6244]
MAKRKRQEAHFTAFFAEVNAESASGTERSLVLLCGAFIDLLLRDLIEHRLIDDAVSKTLLGEDGMGALGTFSSRIDMAFALGTIEQSEHKSLKKLKNIRNDSAHEVSFSLSSPTNIVGIDVMLNNLGFDFTAFAAFDPKVRFRSVAVNLIARLAARTSDQQLEKMKVYDLKGYNNPNAPLIPYVNFTTP